MAFLSATVQQMREQNETFCPLEPAHCMNATLCNMGSFLFLQRSSNSVRFTTLG